MIRHFFLALALTGSLSLPAQALDLQQMTQAERAALHEEIRSYLLSNPDVIRAALEDGTAEPAEARVFSNPLIAANAAEIFEDGYSWVGGNPEGDITLVAFMDYQCGYCRRAYGEVAELLERDGNIRLIVKELPILGTKSTSMAKFAVATKRVVGDEAYAALHGALMDYSGPTHNPGLVALLESLGFDATGVLKDMNSQEPRDIIRKNLELAQRLELTGTPSFVMEDEILGGYMTVAQMQQVTDAIRAQ